MNHYNELMTDGSDTRRTNTSSIPSISSLISNIQSIQSIPLTNDCGSNLINSDFSNYPLDDFNYQKKVDKKTPSIPIQSKQKQNKSRNNDIISSSNDVESQYMPKKHTLLKRMPMDKETFVSKDANKNILCSSPLLLHSNTFTNENIDSMANLNSTLDLLVAVSCQINETNQLKKEEEKRFQESMLISIFFFLIKKYLRF